jgi:hypothetical protein
VFYTIVRTLLILLTKGMSFLEALTEEWAMMVEEEKGVWLMEHFCHAAQATGRFTYSTAPCQN